MNLNRYNKILFLAIFLCITSMIVLSYAESPSKRDNSEESETMSNTTTPDTIENYLNSINDRVKKLENNEKRPKDFWDKFSSVSTFFSGVIIAFIGIYATSAYNKRQLVSQRIQKKSELSVLRVQTVEKFLGHLASEDQTVRRASLDTIAALGDEELAVTLAKRFGGEGGAAVLASLSNSNNPFVAQNASKALSELFSPLQQSIVVVSSGPYFGTGFFVSSDGLFLISTHALGFDPKKYVSVDIPSTGTSCYDSVVKFDISHFGLTLMKAKLTEPVVPIDKFSTTIELGNQVVAISFSRSLERINAVGQITGYYHGPTVSNRIACDIKSVPEMQGAPVFNMKGELMGVAEHAGGAGIRLISGIDLGKYLQEQRSKYRL